MGGKLVLSGLKHMPPAPVAFGAAGDQAVTLTAEDDMLTNGTKRVGKEFNHPSSKGGPHHVLHGAALLHRKITGGFCATKGAFNVGRQLMDVHRSELAESAGHRLKVFSLGF